MEAPASLLKWQFRFDNPDVIGWTVVTAYLIAAFCCGRAALKSRDKSRRSFAGVWWLIAAGLTFLGINKQLNLQTLMIVIGRNMASAGEWYDERRQVQLVFSAGFALLALGALAWWSWRFRHFFKENRLALAGAIVLTVFVVMRAATINHIDAFVHVNLKDKNWAWVLEITGSVLIAIEAFHRSTGEYSE